MPECLRCGECCRKSYGGITFYEKDQERLIENDEWWLEFHPFLFTLYGEDYEMESAVGSGCTTVRHAWFVIREAEREFEEAFEFKQKIPYGGSLTWCPFLSHTGDVWSCLIHVVKPDGCRNYFCESDEREEYKDMRIIRAPSGR